MERCINPSNITHIILLRKHYNKSGYLFQLKLFQILEAMEGFRIHLKLFIEIFVHNSPVNSPAEINFLIFLHFAVLDQRIKSHICRVCISINLQTFKNQRNFCSFIERIDIEIRIHRFHLLRNLFVSLKIQMPHISEIIINLLD